MNNNQLIKTDKFITDYSYIARVIPFALFKENPALANIYSALILKSLKSIQGSNAYHDFLHDNYGCSFYYRINQYNDFLYFGIKLECLSQKYIPNNEDIFQNLVNLAKEVFYETPNFNEELVERNKKELILYIKKMKKQPYAVCSKKVFMQLDPNHRFNFDSIGSIEQVEKVNRKALIEFHQKLSKYPFTLTYQGDNEFNQFERLKEAFPSSFDLPIYQDIPFKEIKEIYNEEEMDSPNTLIMMLYSFKMDYSLDNNYLLRFADRIIGGQCSILFNEIREHKCLCYSINSTAYSSENILSISTQISKESLKLTIDSIKEIIDNFSSYYTEEYFEKAKMDIISELVDRMDNPFDSFNHNLIILYKRNRIDTFENSIKSIESVKYEDVLAFVKTLKLVSTYVVKGED